MKTKSIGWSYPSSTNAVRFGFASAGCWTVSTTEGSNPPVTLSGHAHPSDALREATMIDAEWCWMFLKFLPDLIYQYPEKFADFHHLTQPAPAAV